jgi:hypothetical protein
MSSPGTDAGIETEELGRVLKSQYRAALAMFRAAVEACPDDVWFDTQPRNAFWQVAYHTIFLAHVYLQPRAESFTPWERHQAGVQHEDGIEGEVDRESRLPLLPKPYTKEDVVDYCSFCERTLDAAVDALDLRSPESGFSWYKVSKLEHQLVNIRHIQHHTAQLSDRLRAATGRGVRWVGARVL